VWDFSSQTGTWFATLFYISSGTSLISPKIKIALIRSLEHHGWDADTQIECPSYTYGSPLEDLTLTAEQREEIIQTQLKESAISQRALIVKVSHIGGHKYAGNCIVWLFFFSVRFVISDQAG